MKLCNVYDNVPHNSEFSTGFGFACVVRTGKNTILFDTGGSDPVLLPNLETAGIKPKEIEAVVISHNHWDHTGGLTEFLSRNSRVDVFVPASFPDSFTKEVEGKGARVVMVRDSSELVPGVYTTGELGTSIPEQSLIVDTPEGGVVITGCAHPGIVHILEKAKEARKKKVCLAMGGFHLGSLHESEIKGIIQDFRRLGVRKVAPSHCTGEHAIAMFAEEYGNDCLKTGVGAVIEL